MLLYEGWTADDMPGPTREAKEKQLEQLILRETLYDTLQKVRAQNPELEGIAAYRHAAYIEKRNAYEKTVAELEAMLGENAHCTAVDCDLWDTYSDWFKSEHGIRPRFHVTRAAAQADLQGK